MRTRYIVATALTFLASATGYGQTQGNTGGSGNTGGGGGISGLQTTSASNFQIQQMEVPQITFQGTTTGSTLNSTNSFSQYYANPFYQGRAGAAITEGPGGFGSPLASTGGGGGSGRAVGTNGLNQGRTAGGTGGIGGAGRTNTTTGGLGGTGGLSGGGGTGRTAGITGTTGAGLGGFGGTAGGIGGTTGFGGTTGGLGRTGGQGGRGGLTGLGGQQNNSAIIQLPRQISYTMTIRTPTPKATPAQLQTQMQTDLRGVIDRSSLITNPKGIEVLTDGAIVVLRGTVKDEEEAATAEGIIRLTPGVKVVKNELKY